jgi:hypothetical protein
VHIATWNARQLGADGGTGEGVAEVLSSLEADLIALQEVASPVAFEAVLSKLPEYEGVLGPLATTAGGLQ